MVSPRRGFRGWLGSVDQFWFAKGSPTSLAIFRILIAFFALVDMLMLVPQLGDWFGEKSYVPLSVAKTYIDPLDPHFTMLGIEKFIPMNPDLHFSPPRINLLSGVDNPQIIVAFYALVCIAAFLTMIGLWTKASSIALAIGIVSLHHRNAVILNGGDTVLRISVLYLALAPCGLACSVDRLRALWTGKVGPKAPQVSLWSQKLVQYNLALIYFTTFWLKFGQGSYWRSMTATYYPAHLNEFHRFPVPEFINRPPFIYVSTLGTLIVELALGTIVFYKPARKWVLGAGLAMHAYIEYSMNIPMFSFLVCSLYIAFYSGEEIAGFFQRLGLRFRRFAATVALPLGAQLRPGPANFLVAVDPMGLVHYTPGNRPNFEATDIKKSWTRSIGAWPFAWIPGVWNRILNRAIESAPIAEQTPEIQTRKKVRV